MKRQIVYLSVGFFLFISFISTPKLLGAPYYEGKVITLVVGSPPGGGYDLMARLLAKHLPNHIPGKPTIIVENNPGASSLIAANQLYNRIKPDGFTIGLPQKTIVLMQLLKQEGVEFDVTKFSLIGSSSIDFNVLALRSGLPYKTFNELLKTKEPIFIGGQGPTSMGTQLSLILKEFTGLNAQIVDYRGTSDTWLAIERKECDGVYIAYNSAMQYFERGVVRPIIRTRILRSKVLDLPAELENLPIDEDYMTDPMGKTIMGMFTAVNNAGKPFVAPPGTPANIMSILRGALDQAIKDPQLRAEARKLRIDVVYVPGEEILKNWNHILNQPVEVVKRISKYVKF